MRGPRDDRGLVIPLTALLLTVLILMVSLAVDIGYVSAEIRKVQKAADIASLDGVRALDGRTDAELIADGSVLAAVLASAARNGFGPAGVSYDLGNMVSPAPGQPIDLIFEPSLANEIPDAVKVTIVDTVKYFFQPGDRTVTRDAVGRRVPKVWLEVGSVAAGLDDACSALAVPPVGSANSFIRALTRRLARQLGNLGPLPADSCSADLVSYRGLAAADIDLGRFATQLGFASPEEAFAGTTTVGQFFDASVAVLQAQGDANSVAAAGHLRTLQTRLGANNNSQMNLGSQFASAGATQGGSSAADTSINVLSLLTGGASAVNGANFITFAFDVGIPGVTMSNVQMATIEAAQSKFLSNRSTPGPCAAGNDPECVQTAQVRFSFTLNLPGTPAVPPLIPAGAPIQVPVILESARADAYVTRTDCREPLSESEADAHVDTSAVRVRVGTTVNLSNLNLIIVPHVSISGDASLGGGSDDFTFLPNQPPVDWQRSFGGVGGGNLGTALGLQSPVLTAYAATFSQLDGKVFDPLLKAAGVSLGGADVREFELRCRMPQLVE